MRLRRSSEPTLRAKKDESGFTLIEMTVTIAILAIFMLSFSNTMATISSLAGNVQEHSINQGDAQLVMNVAARDLRTATKLPGAGSPFDGFLAGNNEVEFTAALDDDSAPVLVDLDLNNSGQLIETVTEPSSSSCESGFSYIGGTERIAEYGGDVVDIPNGAPMFTYYDSDGNQLTIQSGMTSLTTAQMATVVTVGVDVQVRHATEFQNISKTELTMKVSLYNLDDNTSGDYCS